jgi:hypothetical protein
MEYECRSALEGVIMWWKSAKLWITVLNELVSIALLVLIAAGYAPATLELVSTLSALVLQLVAVILGAIWGVEVGMRKAS